MIEPVGVSSAMQWVRFPFGRSAPDGSPLPDRTRPGPRRPRVAIALGAGAARGWAEIGVLQELLGAGLTPDVVVGTSMGAVVGGCFCAGRLDQLEAFALSLTRRRVFGLMDFTLSGAGLISGGRLKAMLAKDLGATAEIEALPIRFASVATEIGTGHEVWLSRGNLVDALLASYALPGVFEPVRIDGRWLMDGALVNPVPVSVCRALGAELVIAVNLVSETAPWRGEPMEDGAPATDGGIDAVLASRFRMVRRPPGSTDARRPRRDPGPSMARVLVDAFNITQDRIARSRLAGDPPDLTINVKAGRIGLFDFHRAAELIELGRDAARRSLADVAGLIESRAGSPGAPRG